MDLKAAYSGASWHPLTSLITMETDAEFRELTLVPVLDFIKLGAFSRLFHEVTHAWSVRTMRLGYKLSGDAASLLVQWRNNPAIPLALPVGTAELVGTFLPLLEGIALFAQLDFEVDEPGLPLPSPLTIIMEKCQLNLMRHSETREIFRRYRDEALAEKVDGNLGLLQALYLGTNRSDLGYYFAGYCYVKAIWGLWRAVNPRFADSGMFLPVFIRAVTDHPVIDQFLDGPASPAEVIAAIHASILDIGNHHLSGIIALLDGAAEFRERFDNWDVYAQVASQQWERVLYRPPELLIRYFPLDANGDPLTPADRPLVDQILVARASATVCLTGWREGVLSQDGERITLTGNGEPVSIDHARFCPGYAKAKAPPTIDEASWDEVVRHMCRMEEHFHLQIAEHEGRHVQIGTFLTLTKGSAGAALWIDDKLKAWFAFTPGPFLDPLEQCTIFHGLDLCPADRVRFATHIGGRAETATAATAAVGSLYELMISDTVERSLMGAERFCGIGLGRFNRAVREWAGSAVRGLRPPLPREFTAAGEQMFDFPGFHASPQRVQFSDLLPDLPTLAPESGYQTSDEALNDWIKGLLGPKKEDNS